MHGKTAHGPQDDTETAIIKMDLQFFAEDPAPSDQPPLLVGDPPADPNPASDPNPKPNPDPNPNPNPGDPPKEPPKEPDKPIGAPESYTDFTLPEGFKLDEAINTEFKGLAKEANLPQEVAQKFLDLEIKAFKKIEQANQESFIKLKSDLREKTLAELGANHQQELAFAAKFIDQIGGSELGKEIKTFLADDQFGQLIGNHPLITKLFIAAGKAISEDKLVIGNPGSDPKSAAEVLYPTQK